MKKQYIGNGIAICEKETNDKVMKKFKENPNLLNEFYKALDKLYMGEIKNE